MQSKGGQVKVKTIVTLTNESCPTYQISHVTHTNESCHIYEFASSYMNSSRHTYEFVTSHTWISHVTHFVRCNQGGIGEGEDRSGNIGKVEILKSQPATKFTTQIYSTAHHWEIMQTRVRVLHRCSTNEFSKILNNSACYRIDYTKWRYRWICEIMQVGVRVCTGVSRTNFFL